MAKEKLYIAEVPRFFTKVQAVDLVEAKKRILDDAEKVIDRHALIEDITNKSLPSPSEAMENKKAVSSKVVNIIELGKSISKAVGGPTFLGISDADVLFSSNLCSDLNLEGVGKEPFLSLGGFFSSKVNESKAI